MFYVFLLKQNPLIIKPLLAGFLFWSQVGVISASLITDADNFAGRVPDVVSIQDICISNQLYKTKGESVSL